MRQPAIAIALMLASTTTFAQSGPIARARQVTASYAFDLAPAPDGKRAVLIRMISGREQLFLRQLDDGSEKQITFDDADHEDPTWAPDGGKIGFILIKDGKKVVHLIDPDGSGAQAITPTTQSAIHPSFTPDGKAILYCTDDDLRPPAKNEAEIYAIPSRRGASPR